MAMPSADDIVRCPHCGHKFPAPPPYREGLGTYCPRCARGFQWGA